MFSVPLSVTFPFNASTSCTPARPKSKLSTDAAFKVNPPDRVSVPLDTTPGPTCAVAELATVTAPVIVPVPPNSPTLTATVPVPVEEITELAFKRPELTRMGPLRPELFPLNTSRPVVPVRPAYSSAPLLPVMLPEITTSLAPEWLTKPALAPKSRLQLIVTGASAVNADCGMTCLPIVGLAHSAATPYPPVPCS